MAIDWVNLEIDYSLGDKSLEELSREYEIGVAQIEERAINKGWSCEGIHALSMLRQRFVEEYMVDFNVSNAALRAGVNAVTGRKWMKVPEVHLAISARMREIRHRTDVTQDRIVAQMARVAFGDIRNLFDANGNLKPIHELSEDESAMIEALDVVEGKTDKGNVLLQTKKIKLASKLAYLERLGRYRGLFNDKIEIDARVESKDVSENDFARRLAFVLLQASRRQLAEDSTLLLEEKDQV